MPDLRGEFVRGWDHGAGKDAGRIFASYQDSTTVNAIDYGYLRMITNSDSKEYLGSGVDLASGGATYSLYRYSFRPRNIALLPCIKY